MEVTAMTTDDERLRAATTALAQKAMEKLKSLSQEQKRALCDLGIGQSISEQHRAALTTAELITHRTGALSYTPVGRVASEIARHSRG
jgi:hypothetical protein